MINILIRLKDIPFVRNMLVVMTGSVLAQAIGFALSPVISRLYTPAEFGVFGSFGAISGVIAAGVTLDYSQALMLPRNREDAGQVLLLSCLVTLAATLLCGLVSLLFPGWLLGLLSATDGWLLPLLALAVLVGGLNASFQAWCVRIKAFTHTSASQVLRGCSSSGLQVGLGVAGAGSTGLVLSQVLSEFLAGLNLTWRVKNDLREFLAAVRWRRLRELAAEYRDFPIYSATQNLLNALSNGLPVLLLTQFFGLAVAGAYAFGVRLLVAPMSLVLGALRQVLFQKAGEMSHEGHRLLPLFIRSTSGLFALIVFPALILGFWAPTLFAWVFGGQWRLAGEFARYLVLWLLFSFCNLPAVLFAQVIRIQRDLFLFNLVLLAVRVAAIVWGGLYLTPLQTVAVFSAVGALMNIVLILLVGRALLKRERQGAWRALAEAWRH